MFKLMTKLFIKNKDNVHDANVRMAYGVLASILGIISNLILCGLKIFIGMLTSSISIIADGINNLSDSASSVTTLVGFRLANMPADSEHPYGHHRIEYVCGIIVSIFIIVVGALLGKESIIKIISGEKIDISRFWMLIIILTGSIAVKMWQSYFYRQTAKKINSQTIYASSKDSLNDCISTAAVLIAIIIYKITNVNLDGLFGVLVALFIIINGIKLVIETASPLLGEAPSKEFSKKIIDKINSYDGVMGIHDLMIHSYGPGKTFVTVHVEVDSQVDILKSHDMVDNIERDFFNNEGLLVTIHMDPIETNDELTKILKQIVAEVVKRVDVQFEFHDFRIVKGITHINVLFDVVIPQRYEMTDNEIKKLITNLVKEESSKIVEQEIHVIINIDKDYIKNK